MHSMYILATKICHLYHLTEKFQQFDPLHVRQNNHALNYGDLVIGQSNRQYLFEIFFFLRFSYHFQQNFSTI